MTTLTVNPATTSPGTGSIPKSQPTSDLDATTKRLAKELNIPEKSFEIAMEELSSNDLENRLWSTQIILRDAILAIYKAGLEQEARAFHASLVSLRTNTEIFSDAFYDPGYDPSAEETYLSSSTFRIIQEDIQRITHLADDTNTNRIRMGLDDGTKLFVARLFTFFRNTDPRQNQKTQVFKDTRTSGLQSLYGPLPSDFRDMLIKFDR